MSVEDVEKPPAFGWLSAFGSALLGPYLPITLALTLAVYVLVRAIGWVISGFTAEELP